MTTTNNNNDNDHLIVDNVDVRFLTQPELESNAPEYAASTKAGNEANDQVKDLIRLAKAQGYLTFTDVNPTKFYRAEITLP